MNFKLAIPILIILVSLIYGLPNIILFESLGQDYNPLVITGKSPIARDEAFAYAPFVNFILKGNLLLKEVYVAEYANFPTPFLGETAPSLVFAALAKLSGSIEKAFIIGDFIFPPIIFLLLFFLANLFIKHKLFAASVAFLTTIARDFIATIPYPQQTLQYLTFAEGQNYLLYFSRAFHPQLTFIFFVSAILLLIKLVENPTNKLTIVALGLAFGALFYTYVFHWTYFLLAFLLIFAYWLKTHDLPIIYALLKSGAITFLIGLFYLVNAWQFKKLDLAPDFITKTSLHSLPLPTTLLRYAVVTILFATIVKLKDQKSIVLFLFLLAGVTISPISKLIIGQDLETFHYLRRALMPLSTIAVFVIIYSLIRGKALLLVTISAAIFLIALFLGIRTQTIAPERIQTAHQRDKAQFAVMSWLLKNTPKDSVVGSLDTNFSSLLPVYTHNHVYFPPTDRTITPTAEGMERYAILASILGVPSTWQKSNLDNILSYLFVYQAYDNQNNLDLNSPKRQQAQSQIDSIEESGDTSFHKFKLDYIVVTPDHLSQVHPNLKFISVMTSINEFIIFKVDLK